VIRRWVIWLAIVAGSFLPATSGRAATHERAVASTARSVPSNIKADCSVADSGPALGDWLNSLPANTTVEFPTNGCFHILHSLDIHGTTGLTIDGNGSTLSQTFDNGAGDVQGILYLSQDTNFAVSDLKVTGAYNGSNGGGGYEADYGLFMEANHGVTITNMHMIDIQGDFIILDPPQNNDTGTDQSLNTNVKITNSTFTNAGYHGITIESVNGFTFEHNTVTNVGVDAIDAEYDTYSTSFDANGNAEQAAQDNIIIAGNTWTNFGDIWYASLQGQLPGVQQQNVNLSYNTINGGSGIVEITGTNQGLTTPQYQNRGLTIAFNKGLQPAVGTTGASIAGTPGTTAAMQIQYVTNATIAGNVLPLFDGTPRYFANTPYVSVLQAYGIHNLTMKSNNFSGAYDILQAGSSGNTILQRGNKYGVKGSSTDGPP
jgi:hypothetical protein